LLCIVEESFGKASASPSTLTGHKSNSYASTHLVVLLDPADIVENIHFAYRHPAFQQAAYAVLLSGPSGSADIGGVTVHPAQGVTTLTVVLSPRNGEPSPDLATT
jgi:L-lactate dehydrogenase complex protein LldG